MDLQTFAQSMSVWSFSTTSSGKASTGVKNLFPEPRCEQYDFHIKDRFENYLHNAVCNGSMILSEARKQL